MPAKRTGPLDEYKHKRDFRRTPEPKPARKKSKTGDLFVVQKHRARQLHYDFRLELNGVLLSWAVPKGPSLDPSEKRLAVQTEDHPLDYGSFEGIIPEDEYGGGTVMLWDRGRWSPLEDFKAGLAKGTLKFKLDGQKLRGAWTLVRLKEKGSSTGKNWLLIKERDEEVRNEETFSVIDEEPFSTVSGRTIGEIASARERVWSEGGSRGAAYEIPHYWRRGLHPATDFSPGHLPNARKSKMPHDVIPICFKEAESIPSGAGWIHEILQLGERVICLIEDDRVTLRPSPGTDWSQRFPRIVRAASALPIQTALLDGVISGIHEAKGTTSEDAQYNVFDIVFCDGYDLRATALLERKQLLSKTVESAGAPLVYCDHVEGRGDLLVAEARKLGAPGIISRKTTSTYLQGGTNWRVARMTQQDEKAPATQRRRAHARTDDPEITVGGIKLTHPHRILYPEERVNKRMLAEYYDAIAPIMLPYLRGRPLSLYRCPGGIEKECFFQKQLGEMKSTHLRGAGSDGEPFVVLDDAQGLITLSQWNVLEIHCWGCREPDLEQPDWMIFDLDPGPGVSWELIVEGAKGLRFLLDQLHLKSFVKTSGGKGLHVVVPLSTSQHLKTKASKEDSTRDLPCHDWHDVKDFSARVARRIVDVAPTHFTVFMSKPERRGKVFIDYHRNDRGSTCVAPYSTRARPGAFVSTPIAWEELDGEQRRFHVFQVLKRLQEGENPWQDFLKTRQHISSEAINWLRG